MYVVDIIQIKSWNEIIPFFQNFKLYFNPYFLRDTGIQYPFKMFVNNSSSP